MPPSIPPKINVTIRTICETKRDKILGNQVGPQFHSSQVSISQNLRREPIPLAHNSPLVGHFEHAVSRVGLGNICDLLDNFWSNDYKKLHMPIRVRHRPA